MYENAKDQKGLQITEKKKVEIEKNIENLKKKLKELKEELPPRPLPQPEFVSGTYRHQGILYYS
jgi:sugar-specific transcriptional regulator TrmB